MGEDTVKRNKRQYAWQKANKERINILFEPGTKERIQLAAYQNKTSSSDYIRSAIEIALQKDNV